MHAGLNILFSSREYSIEIAPASSSHQHILNNKFFVCLHGDKIYNSFVCGNTT